jgi:Flp pilus assembly pilin Flp
VVPAGGLTNASPAPGGARFFDYQAEGGAMKAAFMTFLQREEGAQMAEYALLLVLIGVLLIAAVLYLSGVIGNTFHAVANCIVNNTDCPPPSS